MICKYKFELPQKSLLGFGTGSAEQDLGVVIAVAAAIIRVKRVT